MTIWADWVMALLAEQEGPSNWSRERQRAEQQWREVWCPPNHIKVGVHLVSVERKRRIKWQQAA
jgi:hypothetical protein